MIPNLENKEDEEAILTTLSSSKEALESLLSYVHPSSN
jgi:hypothetical protein